MPLVLVVTLWKVPFQVEPIPQVPFWVPPDFKWAIQTPRKDII